MCLHDSRTVVAGGKMAIWQCDMCGAVLWWLDVPEDVVPVAIDLQALAMWEVRTADAVVRETQRLDLLRASDPAAYRATVAAVLQRDAITKKAERWTSR
jgi:hypothetical protein